ncbi:MAG: DUF4399 domain-containing protein [Mariprofundaceae bacterium]|nr:DUF4399 domain-containing protein [Mariprofundaceae bacterium]
MQTWLKTILLGVSLSLASGLTMAAGHLEGEHKEQSKQGAYFISPLHQATVAQKVQVEMGIHGMKVRQAGTLVEGTGHHHLIIDGAFVPQGEAVPKDARHIHFGKGQTSTSINLSPGKHTLTLQFADGYHQSYGEHASQSIEVMVKD